MEKTNSVFASHVNGIEFDVTDPVTAKLLRSNAKSDYIHEVDANGEPVVTSAKGKRGQATGCEIELDNE